MVPDYGEGVAAPGEVETAHQAGAKGRKLGGFGSFFHLAIRFFGALSPAGPSPADAAWAAARLSADEQRLFSRMSGPDKRHAVGVARQALLLAGEDGLGEEELPAGFVAAALLHDVGKIESRLGTFGRVFATLLAIGLGRSRLQAWKGRIGQEVSKYLAHDRIGAELLETAGSTELTVNWARDHHLPPARWRLDSKLAGYLKEADGD